MKRGLTAGLSLALLGGGAFAQGTGGNLQFTPTFDDIVNSQSGVPATTATTGPSAPYTANVDAQLGQLEPLLQRILQMQGNVLSQIQAAGAVTDTGQKTDLINQIRLVVYGTDAAHPTPQTLEALYTDPMLSDLVNQLAQVDPAAASQDVYYMRVMGEGGEWPTVHDQEMQIRNFLSANSSVPSPYSSASASPPVTAAPAVPAPSASPQPQTVDQVNAQLTQIINQLNANPPPPADVQAQLLARENQLIALRNQLQGNTTASAAPPGTPGAPGNTASQAGGSQGQGAAQGGGGGGVQYVPNSYNIQPMVLTDAQIKAILDPLISQQLATKNAQLSSQGLSMNADMQITGPGVQAAYRPSWERYSQWMQQVPSMRDAVMKAAQAQYNAEASKARAGQGGQGPANNPASNSGPAGTVSH